MVVDSLELFIISVLDVGFALIGATSPCVKPDSTFQIEYSS